MQYTDKLGEFTRLLKEHEVCLRATAVSLMMNHADGEEVFQIAALTVWEKFDEFVTGTSFAAWAGRIVYLKAIAQRRQRGRDRLKFGEAFVEAVARVTTGEEFVAGTSDRRLALNECLTKMNPQHQQMLRLRYAEKISADRMGVLFNRSGVAVRNVLKRLRASLHKCISERTHQKELKWQMTQPNQMDKKIPKGHRRE